MSSTPVSSSPVLIGSRGSAPDRVFNAWIDDRLEVIASPQLIAELRRVVQRPKFRRWFDSRTAQQLVERIERHAALHEDPPAATATRDPKDDYLVALARVAHADAIVSGDSDLHDAELPDVLIWTPRNLADLLSLDSPFLSGGEGRMTS